jgi:hypothetical protein
MRMPVYLIDSRFSFDDGEGGDPHFRCPQPSTENTGPTMKSERAISMPVTYCATMRDLGRIYRNSGCSVLIRSILFFLWLADWTILHAMH